jgi:hypothetical protein
VYLNDSGPVLFKHAGDDARVAKRPPTKAGAFRLFRGVAEIHEVEHTSDLPSDFLRVELKTDPKAPLTLRGKFFRETPPPGQSLEKVKFENVQIRVTRLVIAACRHVDIRTTPEEPALLIALTPIGASLALGQEPLDINGTAVGTGYDRLAATSALIRPGVTLQTSLGYTPSPADTFLVLTNVISVVFNPFDGTSGNGGAGYDLGGFNTLVRYDDGTGDDDMSLTVDALPSTSVIADTTIDEDGVYNGGVILLFGAHVPVDGRQRERRADHDGHRPEDHRRRHADRPDRLRRRRYRRMPPERDDRCHILQSGHRR